MANPRVRIAHPDGRSFDVPRRVFDRRYAAEGFEITANADGSAIDAPKAPKSPKPAAGKARDRSAAARKGVATKAAAKAAAAQAVGSASAAGEGPG